MFFFFLLLYNSIYLFICLFISVFHLFINFFRLFPTVGSLGSADLGLGGGKTPPGLDLRSSPETFSTYHIYNNNLRYLKDDIRRMSKHKPLCTVV